MSAHSAWRPKEVSHLYRESRPAGIHGGKQASNSQHCGPTGRRQRDESCPIKVPNPGSTPHLFSHDLGWPARTYKCTGRTSWRRKCRMLWTLNKTIVLLPTFISSSSYHRHVLYHVMLWYKQYNWSTYIVGSLKKSYFFFVAVSTDLYSPAFWLGTLC